EMKICRLLGRQLYKVLRCCSWNNACPEVRRDKDQDTHQKGQDQSVEENEAQDGPLLAMLPGRGGGPHDALGIDHLAHDPAGAVGGGQQDSCSIVLRKM